MSRPRLVERRPRWAARGRGHDGMVTAETALVLPVLVCVVVGLAWLVVLGAAQVRCVDAAREVARLSARGESATTVAAAVARLAPDARWQVREEAGLVVASVDTEVRPRIPLLGELPAVDLTAEAAAAQEPQ